MLKRQVMDGGNNWAWRKWRRRVLHVKQVHRMTPQFYRQRQRNTHQGRMRQCLPDLEIGPTILEPLDGDGFGNVERVKVGLIDLSKGLDQVDGVTFVAAELRSDGMRVDCDVQDRLRSSLM